MKTFEVWSEGFAATGESGRAMRTGSASAESFREACDKVMRGKADYNRERLTYWGCRLFDNETDARKAFG